MASETRARLTALRSEAVARAEALDAESAALTRERADRNDDDEHDPEGEPLSAQWSRLRGLLRDAQGELAQIDGALQRLDAGTYGICPGCGNPLPPARLEARPFAERCVPCAERG